MQTTTTHAVGATRAQRVGAPLSLAGFVAAIAIAHWWGERIVDSGRNIKVGVPPLHAVADLHLGGGHLVLVGVAVIAVVALPRVATTMPWRSATVVAATTSIAWTVALNATRGSDAFVQGLDNRHEYLRDVPNVGSPLSFLRHFTERFDSYTTHTQGHPPGFPIVLWTLDRLGLHGAGWIAVLCIASGAVAVVAVLVATRDVMGEHVARNALPFVAVAPTALWIASSADAFFAAVGALAVAGIVRGLVHNRTVPAALGGAGLGVAMLCTYGAALLVVIPGALALRVRRVAPLVVAGAAAAGVLLLAYAAGFDYLDGLRHTRRAYAAGVASVRPYSYALFANPALLAIAIGPATVCGLTRTRLGVAPLVAGALTAVALADLSGMSKLEVERIWLPFAAWLLPAAAAADRGAMMVRRWLTLQILCAVAVQTVVRTGW